MDVNFEFWLNMGGVKSFSETAVKHLYNQLKTWDSNWFVFYEE